MDIHVHERVCNCCRQVVATKKAIFWQRRRGWSYATIKKIKSSLDYSIDRLGPDKSIKEKIHLCECCLRDIIYEVRTQSEKMEARKNEVNAK